MLAPQTLQHLDQLLNELEELARSGTSPSQFFHILVERMQYVLGCTSASIIQPASATTYATIADCGDDQTSSITAFLNQWHTIASTRRAVVDGTGSVPAASVNRAVVDGTGSVPGASVSAASVSAASVSTASHSTSAHLSGQIGQAYWIAQAVQQNNFEKGTLLVTFGTRPSETIAGSLLEILSAFAEIASLQQLLEMEAFIRQRWQLVESLTSELTTTDNLLDAAQLLVNHSIAILGAVRVSLANATMLGAVRMLAISGVPTIDERSESVKRLLGLVEEVMHQQRPLVHQSPPQKGQASSTVPSSTVPPQKGQASFGGGSFGGATDGATNVQLEDGLFTNHIAIPFASNSVGQRSGSVSPSRAGSTAAATSYLVVEWNNRDDMIRSLPAASHVLPLLASSWSQHRRWLQVPRMFRGWWNWNLGLGPSLRKAVRWAIVLVLAFVAYRVMVMDYTFSIEATAVLDPHIKRSIFASADGYVTEVLVSDGDTVKAGQPIASLRSPLLELQMEELRGQQRTLAEKRAGLRIATGQIDPSSRDALATQSRLSAEVAQINTQEANLEKQLKLLSAERDKLQLHSPIDGVVVAREVKQQLAERPVARGDALMTIVDLNGPWQLRIDVADRDSGYVQKYYAANGQVSGEVDFVFDSLPEKKFAATVRSMAELVQNRHGEGCYLEVLADVDRAVVEQSQMGAGAHVYFRCGQQPLWFVWCRPLIEAAQRKFWFWSPATNND